MRTKSREEEQLLTRGELSLIVLSVLPVFFFWAGPIWEHPFRIDAAIAWSYAPIPFLVAAVLQRRRVLSAAGFIVNTITAVSVKYMVTTTIAFLFWAVIDPPALAQSAPEQTSGVHATGPARATGDADLELQLDSRAISSSRLQIANGETVALRSLDGSLHTLRARRADGTIAFNLPVVPGKASKPFTLRVAPGPLELSCAVHTRERHATLLVE